MEIEGLDDLNMNMEETSTETDSTDDIQDLDQVDETNTNEDDAEGDSTNTTEEAAIETDDVDTTQNTEDEGTDSSEKTQEGNTDIKGEVDDNLSGVERYLSAFNIEGGMIDFKDGSSTHFNELPADKQAEVLTKLHETSAKGVEEKYGLDEDEIGLINYIRQQEGTVDDVINNIAQQRAQTYITSQQVQDMDISKMGNDEIYTSFLMKSNPEITTEQLEQDLETAKKMSNYDNIVNNIKDGMVQERESTLNQQKQESNANMMSEIEDQRKQVVDKVSKMDAVDGLTINDGIKNDVLDLILNVDDDGDSLFMTDVFGDPEKLFKAAFWYKNGTDIISSREDYWKKEKSAAYKRGVKDAQTGKKTFTSDEVGAKTKTTPQFIDPEEGMSMDDLHIIQ